MRPKSLEMALESGGRRSTMLEEQFAESARLEAAIRDNPRLLIDEGAEVR